MSVQCCKRPLTSSSYNAFKFASTVATKTPRLGRPRPSSVRYCDHARIPTRRPLSTATEYHPRSLDTTPPPPRNANIPDTSIAGIAPEINNTRPTRQTSQFDSSDPNKPEKQTISITETEAQKSKPVTNPPSSSSPPTD